MKKKSLILIITAFAVITQAFAQNCDKFAYMTKGKVIKYSSINANGKAAAKMTYTVLSKTGNKAKVKSEVVDDKGKPLTSAEVEMLCDGNNLKLDMRNFMPASGLPQLKGMTVKADVSYLTYPEKMQTGQKLPDGIFSMHMFKETKKMVDMDCKIQNRNVESREKITTPAGTYDCFKITYSIELKTTTMGFSMPVSMKVSEWYAAKLGLFVKSESTDKNGRLTSTTVLESIN